VGDRSKAYFQEWFSCKSRELEIFIFQGSLNSVHIDEPLLFETRWVMSYLKGPISNNDIKRLMAAKKDKPGNQATEVQTPSFGNVSDVRAGAGLSPVVPQAIEQLYHLQNVVSEEVRFEPWLGAEAPVRFFNAKRNIDVVRGINLRLYLDESLMRPDWESSEIGTYRLADCKLNPPAGST
jgi:hypothetical protein